MINEKQFQETIEDLIFNNTIYKDLQAYLGDFNIFDAVGMSNQEIRHSSFLAYLLNPTAPHHLSDTLLKEFLITAMKQVDSDVSPIEIDTSDYSNSFVNTEEPTDKGQRIDIFVQNKTHKLIVVIENKVYSGETGAQLKDYKAFVRNKYKDYRHLFVYLTPDERAPKNDEMAITYANVTYSDVADIIERTTKNNKNQANQESILLMRHYVEMLKRNGIIHDPIVNKYQKLWNNQYAPILNVLKEISEKSETSSYSTAIIETADRLHKSRHQPALQFLYNLKPNLRSQIKARFLHHIQTDQIRKFIVSHDGIYHIAYCDSKWQLHYGDNEILTLIDSWLSVENNQVVVTAGVLVRNRPMRTQIVHTIYDAKAKNRQAFNRIQKTVYKNWNRIFTRKIISEQELSSYTVLNDDLRHLIAVPWQKVLEENIKPLTQLIENLKDNEVWQNLEAEWRKTHDNILKSEDE